MNSYETFATVEEHGQIRVVGTPFEPGTEVEVTRRARRMLVEASISSDVAWPMPVP